MSSDAANDVALCGCEAMTNVVLHAYPAGTTGFLELHARLERTEIVVTVADHGRWDDQSDTSGNGLALIHSMADDSDVVLGAHGTTVWMCWTGGQWQH